MLFRSVFAGTVAALLANVSLFLMNLAIPGPTVNMPQLTMEFFLDVDQYHTFLGTVMGVTWSLMVGTAYAVVYMMVLHRTGWSHLWLKAIIVITGLWLLGAGFVIRLLNLALYVRNAPLSVFAFFVAHLLFATYLALIVQRVAPEEPASG